MRYESGDIATYYFVIYDDGNNKTIIGWSDNKKIIKAYMDLHKCKRFKLKEYTAPIDKIGKLLDENINDEIRLINVGITKKNDLEYLIMPGTELENNYIKDESNNFLYTRINYSLINEAMPFLKDKYKKALEDIYIDYIIDALLFNKPNKISSNIIYNDLLILTRGFPERFDS